MFSGKRLGQQWCERKRYAVRKGFRGECFGIVLVERWWERMMPKCFGIVLVERWSERMMPKCFGIVLVERWWERMMPGGDGGGWKAHGEHGAPKQAKSSSFSHLPKPPQSPLSLQSTTKQAMISHHISHTSIPFSQKQGSS
jgi:hypothetical protein